MLVVALFIITKHWKQTVVYENKLWYIRSKENYSSVKINELTDTYINMDVSQKYTAKLKKLDTPPQISDILFAI